MPRHTLKWELIIEGTPPQLSWRDPSVQLSWIETLLESNKITKEQFDRIIVALKLDKYDPDKGDSIWREKYRRSK